MKKIKNVFLLLIMILTFAACQNKTSASNDELSSHDIVEQNYRDYLDKIISYDDKVNEVIFSINNNGLSQKGNLTFGANETLLKAKYQEESEDIDEDGNLIVKDYNKVVYAGIENDKAFYVNYLENNIEASNSIGYQINDNDTEDGNTLTTLEAKELLNNKSYFPFTLNWFAGQCKTFYLDFQLKSNYREESNNDNKTIYGEASYEIVGDEGFVYTYLATLELDKNGALKHGVFENYQYNYNDYYQNEKKEPYYSYIAEVNLSYNDKTDFDFDYQQYFISNIKDVAFRSDTSSKVNQVCLREIVMFDILDYETTSALDQLNYYIKNVEDPTIIAYENNHYVAKKVGKTKITIGNVYNDVSFTSEITVVHPDLVGFNAYTSNHTTTIVKKIGESDYVEVAFSPEGAAHDVECKVDNSTKDYVKLSPQREVERNGFVYIVFDFECLKVGSAKIKVTPLEAPTFVIEITVIIVES